MRESSRRRDTRRRSAAGELALMLMMVTVPGASADVIVVDTTSPGAAFDALIDGFPGLASFDGMADFGGNAWAVALKSGVTEERAIIEFPLEDLIGLVAADVETATLTFNIDDVLSTFGPGTAFDATAAEAILVFAYAGDGTVDLVDFEHTAAARLATIDTTANGTVVITDASLRESGPIAFEVDVTAALKSRLAAGDTHLGIVLSTTDDQTGTSLDDLGVGAGGPPGIGGAVLPFVTIETRQGGTTTTSTSTSTTTLPQSTCGDANGDGLITASDGLVVLRVAVGIESCPPSICDVDANGSVTAGDALRVLRSAVGLGVELSCAA